MIDTDTSAHHPGLFRHFAVVFYDWLLVLAVLMLAALLAVAVNHGQAIAPDNVFFKLYLLLIIFFYYGWFWTHGGQTLGMRAWKVRLNNTKPQPISWRQALVRFVVALPGWLLIGAGFWLGWFSHNGVSLADKVSGTRLQLRK